MSIRVFPALLLATVSVMPGVLLAQRPVELARGGPQPHFVAAWAPDREREAEHSAVLAGRVSLELEDVSLDEALKALTNEAGLNITYSPAVLPQSKRVTIKAGDIAVITALTEMLFRSGLDVVVDQDGTLALIPCRHLARAEVQDSGAIVGRVTDKATEGPLSGATVLLEGTSRIATTDGQGRFRLAGILPGVYTVRARYIGYAVGSTSVTVLAEQEVKADFALEKSVQVLQEVVTTGTIVPTEVKALPTPVTVIGSDEIALRNPQSLVDVLRQAVPTAGGFDVPFYPARTEFTLRGASSLSTAGQVKILIDGVEATSFASSPVDPKSIERIEVVRGPQAATLYGADAASGVIQIFTKRGDSGSTGPRVSAEAALGVLQTPYDGYGGVLRQNYAGSVRGGGADASYAFGGSYNRLADYVPTGEVSRQESPSIYGGIRFGQGILTADLSGRYYRNKLPVVNNPLALTTGFIPASRPNFETDDFGNETYGARITLTPRGWWWNQLTLGLDRQTIRQTQTQRRLTTPDDTLLYFFNGNSRKISIGYNSSLTTNVSRNLTGTLTVGIDHFDQDAGNVFTFQALNTDGTIQTSPPGAFTANANTVTNTGYFGQLQVNMRDAVFLTAGLRADNNSAYGRDLGTPVLPRVGLSVVRQWGRTTLKARASYGEAIRAPGPGQGSSAATQFAIQLPNLLLKPERQQGWDAGLDLVLGQRASFSITGYDQTAKDLIGLVPLELSPVFTYQFGNIGRVANRGVEFEGTLSLDPVQLRAQYGYIRSRIEDLGPDVPPGADLQVGDRPLSGPEHTAGATLTVAPRQGTSVAAGVTYVGSYRNFDFLALNRCLGSTGPCPDSFGSTGSTRDFIVDYPGFAKLNATITQRLVQHLEVFISVDNLTNNQAAEGGTFNPVTGRLTMLGLNATY